MIWSALGAEGLPLRPGEHYLRADSADEFVAAIERVRGGGLDPALDAARDAASALTWPRIAAELAERYSTSVR